MQVGRNQGEDGGFDNSKVDVFSVGVTAIAIQSGTSPFYFIDNQGNFQVDMDTYNMLRDGNFDAFWTKAANVPWDPKPEFSAKFKDLIWRMIRFDPRDRCTLEEAFDKADAHGWYDDCDQNEIKAYVKTTLEEQERAFQ